MYKISTKGRGVCRLYGIGDIHVGSLNYAEQVAKWVIEEVKRDPNGMLVVMGDLIDAILFDDRRYDASNVDPKYESIMDAIDHVIELLRPVKKKIVVVLRGNHEHTVEKRIGRSIAKLIHEVFGTYGAAAAEKHPDIKKLREIQNKGLAEYIAEQLGVPYGGEFALVTVNFPKGEKVEILARHGMGGGGSPSAPIRKMMDWARFHENWDIAIQGHVHQLGTVPYTQLVLVNDEVQQRVKALMLNPSCVKTYLENTTGYGEAHGYAPSNLGLVWTTFDKYGVVDSGWRPYRGKKEMAARK